MENLTSRQQDILNVIVEEYIEVLKPVGSIIVSKKMKSISPATIRSEMLELEKGGYITTEASLGRIPSEQTILYYLKDKIEKFNNKTYEEIQEYANKYSLPFFRLNRIEKEKIICIFLHSINEQTILFTVVLSSGIVYNRVFNLKEDLSQLEILKLNELLKKTFQNKDLLNLEKFAECCDKYKKHREFFVIESILEIDIFEEIKQKLLIENNCFKYDKNCYTENVFETKIIDKKVLLLFSNTDIIYGIKLNLKIEE